MNALALKKALREGPVPLGTWIFEFNTPGIARLLASAGADFVVLDMEHSGFGTDSVRGLLGQTHALNLAAWVRPPAAHYHLIAPLLDAGADGILAPMIETREDALQVVRACRYPPHGRRGAAFSIAHDDFLPGTVSDKMRAADAKVLCGLLIESPQAVESLDTILDVPGIDLVWVGHFDLSLTMGIPAQFNDARFLRAVDRILAACNSRRIPIGIMVVSPEHAMECIERGYRCLSYWGDIWLLQRALAEGLRTIRERAGKDLNG